MDSHGDIGFIVHATYRIRKGVPEVLLFGRLKEGGTFVVRDTRRRPTFYVPASDEARATEIIDEGRHPATIIPTAYRTMDGGHLAAIETDIPPSVPALRDALHEAQVRTYEADVRFARRYLIDRRVRGSAEITGEWQPGRRVGRIYTNPELAPSDWRPRLAVLSMDIETDRRADHIFAISLVATGPEPRNRTEEVLVVGQPDGDEPPEIRCCANEEALLKVCCERVAELDPDIITGWNVIDFDLMVIAKRCEACGVPFRIGRSDYPLRYRPAEPGRRSQVTVEGRQVIDALRLVRATLKRYDDHRLDTVAHAVLGRGKTLQASEDEDMVEVIARAYRTDRAAFCEYCLEDARLVRDILDAEGLIRLTIRRSLLNGLQIEQAWGSVAAFDFLYLSALHERGIAAPTVGVDQPSGQGVPGGFILSPQAGLWRDVLVFDFQSLYPSIIRTFNVDPLCHVAEPRDGEDLIVAPNGAAFRREPGILPSILDRFFASRARARADGDSVASQAYKTIMNSFYGVLATRACRFASPALAGAITSFGQSLLCWLRDTLEQEGLRVLYGDTDSVFVQVDLGGEAGPEAAHRLAGELRAMLNERLAAYVDETFGVRSSLDLEFEKYYGRFFLPEVRGASNAVPQGRAKAYAGLRVDAEGASLEIVGMEAVRRDWTKLAHEVQREVLLLVFRDTPPKEIEQYVRSVCDEVRSGRRDHQLVYRKALRKSIDAYTKVRPPHVKAAEILAQRPDQSPPSGVIRYLWTVSGPQPEGHTDAAIDYEHYISKQIGPIVASIAPPAGLDVTFALGGSRQLRLF